MKDRPRMIKKICWSRQRMTDKKILWDKTLKKNYLLQTQTVCDKKNCLGKTQTFCDRHILSVTDTYLLWQTKIFCDRLTETDFLWQTQSVCDRRRLSVTDIDCLLGRGYLGVTDFFLILPFPIINLSRIKWVLHLQKN